MPTDSNRISNAITLYVEQEIIYRIGNPEGSSRDQYSLELKMQYYKDLVRHFNKNLSRDERETRQYLKSEIQKLTVSSNPNFLNYLLYGSPSRWLRNLLAGNHKAVSKNNNAVDQFRNRIAIEQNTNQLNIAIKQSGFTQDISPLLQKMVAQGLPQFHIRYADIRHPDTDFILHFKNIPGSGAYEFEKWDVANKPKQGQSNSPSEQQVWFSFKHRSDIVFMANETAHLVAGKAVYKEDNGKWYIQDKVNSMHPIQTKDFDIKVALSKLPLQEMSKVQFNNLLKALKTGTTKEVTLKINGEPEAYFLVAAPQSQSIKVLDKHNRLIDVKALKNKQLDQNKRIAKLIDHSNEEVVDLDLRSSKKIAR